MQTRSDNLIRSDVLYELKWDPKIGSSSDIAVAIKDGVVNFPDSRIAIGRGLHLEAQWSKAISL